MPNFTEPFPGLCKPLKGNDLVRALRLDLAAEEDAVNLYTAHADATDIIVVKEILNDIANEERVHIGEITRLIQAFAPDEANLIHRGTAEVNKKFPKLVGVGIKH